MSNICKNNYSNTGSYLRSRGYDQQICSLITQVNNGQVRIGSIIPNGADGAALYGIIQIFSKTDKNGYLVVNGGDNQDINKFSIQANNGMKLAGPIVQTASNLSYTQDLSYTFGNVFRGNQHVFTNNDGSCNLLLNGHMYSFGAVPSVAATTGSGTIDICANSTDTTGRIYLGSDWTSGEGFTLTFTKPYTEIPVFIYTPDVGANRTKISNSVSTTSVVFTAGGTLDAGYLNYHTIGIQE